MIIKLIEFLLLLLIQGVFINGLKESMGEGMILEPVSKWAKSKLGEFWSKPIVGCVICQSSFWGTITFWSTVLIFGIEFSWQLIPIWIADVFCLVYVNAFLYKKL